MITWMLYSLLVAVLLTLAAHGAEKVLRLRGRSTRWVWFAALVLSLGLPALLPWLMRTLASDGAGLLVPAATVTLSLPVLVTNAEPVIPWGRVVLFVWLALSAALALYGGWSLWRLQRSRRSWRSAEMLGHDVYISRDLGPAVVGVVDPAIVVPRWVPTLPEREQALILAHECEHIAEGDHWLVRAAQIAPLFMPWNPALWLQSRRLRECVELDCDARLLAAGENADGYAELLLNVGQRATRIVLAAAMAEPRTLLEKRIMRMFERRPRRVLLRMAAWSAFALLAIVAAFNAPLPANAALGKEPRGGQRTDPTQQQADATVGQPIVKGWRVPARRQPLQTEPVVEQRSPFVEPVEARQEQQQQQQDQGPTFTPFTVPPELLNASEVSQALRAFYPPLLRDANIGGVVKLWFHIDKRGEVTRVLLKTSSGHQALDEAAMKVADIMRFSPAQNRDQLVAVWVDMPIVFRGPARDTAKAGQTMSRAQAEWAETMARNDRQKLDSVAVRLDRLAIPGNPPSERSARARERVVDSVTVATRRAREAEAAMPALLNSEEVARGLQRYYPPLLRDAGIGGEVLVWFYVDEQGFVTKTAVKKSSGHPALDDAAIRVAEIMKFTPAIKDGQPVAAWIDLPIVFKTQ